MHVWFSGCRVKTWAAFGAAGDSVEGGPGGGGSGKIQKITTLKE